MSNEEVFLWFVLFLPIAMGLGWIVTSAVEWVEENFGE